MGSQTSTSRHQALSDAHQSGIPGIGLFHRYDVNGRLVQPPLGVHIGHEEQRNNAPPLAHVPETADASQRKATKQVSPVEEKPYNEDELIQCVFSWYHGGHNVYLTGSFNNWSMEHKIRLIRSGHEFTIIKELHRGLHLYKFIVDEQWRYAPDQHTRSDEHGNINNVLDIRDFTHYQFKLPNEYEQACNAVYHQYIPEPSEYSTDAPTVPILLSKSTCMINEIPPRWNIPLHCISNHLYHDAHAAKIFGPNVSCIATTQRWKINPKYITNGQRYSTCMYITINPLFPTPIDTCDSFFACNPLKSLIACKSPEKNPFINTTNNATNCNSNNGRGGEGAGGGGGGGGDFKVVGTDYAHTNNPSNNNCNNSRNDTSLGDNNGVHTPNFFCVNSPAGIDGNNAPTDNNNNAVYVFPPSNTTCRGGGAGCGNVMGGGGGGWNSGGGFESVDDTRNKKKNTNNIDQLLNKTHITEGTGGGGGGGWQRSNSNSVSSSAQTNMAKNADENGGKREGGGEGRGDRES